MTDNKWVADEVKCSSPEELLEILHRKNNLWQQDQSQWIFRGVANLKEHRLIPSAYREDGFKNFAGIIGTREQLEQECIEGGHDLYDPPFIFGCEQMLVSAFGETLNEAGLAMPTPGPSVFHNEKASADFFSLPTEAWPLWALARHHGIPTTLLDWTRKPLIAAYFGAEGAASEDRIKTENLDLEIGIWALKKPQVDYFFHPYPAYEKLVFYQPPSSTNPNLHAQAGLFTILHDGSIRSVDEYINEIGDHLQTPFRTVEPPIIRLFTMSRKQVFKLLRLFSEDGYNGASMFPGYDGIVKYLREKSLYA